MASILITGASGFIGSFLIEGGLERGFDVWAGVRPSSSRRYLQDERIRFFNLDLGSDDALRRDLLAHKAENGPFDYVIHAAGATKCKKESDFFRVNTDGTERLARLLVETGTLTKEGRFVFLSSLSVFGAVRDKDMEPISPTDMPEPNTAYGKSKLAAEQALARVPDLHYVVLRPTGVYGPRERDYFLMAKSVMQRVDCAVGFKEQIITFIYVRDVVQAAYLALSKGPDGQAYLLTDGANYNSQDFGRLLQQHLGVSHVLRPTIPLFVLKGVCAIGSLLSGFSKNPPTLNLDKYRILKQRNWQADISRARELLDYEPAWPLDRGVEETVRWYIENGWI
ncbi:MAG: NAD(P)-dependent oxidoreductase [Alloprevotella sp.]|nr:NAD(P)-dependent oxidoreductase [Alloprevotella sp.]